MDFISDLINFFSLQNYFFLNSGFLRKHFL